MEYTAFISYKHERSSEFARRLELDLKRYAKPWYRRPIRIFRDETHLVPGENLPALIRSALTESEYLILLASPEAAASPWVADELRYWCEDLARRERLIIVLTGGSIAIDETTKTIDWARTDALPPLMAEYLDAVPLYVDLSWVTKADGRLLANADYKQAINSISARLRGLDPNEMLGAEIREYRRNRRWALSAGTAVVVTVVVAVILATRVAIVSSRHALERESEDWAMRARTAQSDNAVAGLMLSLMALERATTADALQALSAALSLTRVRGLLPSDREIVTAAFSPDDSVIGTIAVDGTITFWSAEVLLPLANIPSPLKDAVEISFSATGDRVFVIASEGICGWNVPDLEHLGCWKRDTLLSATHAPDGRSVQLSGEGLEWVDLDKDERTLFPGLEAAVIGAVRFSTDGKTAAVAFMPDDIAKSGVLVLRSKNGSLATSRTQNMNSLPTGLLLSPNGRWLMSVDRERKIVVSDSKSGETVSDIELEADVVGMDFSPENGWAVVVDRQGQVTVFETGVKKTRRTFNADMRRLGHITSVDLLNDVPWIVLAGSAGRAEVYDRRGQEVMDLSGGSRPMNGVVASHDHRYLLSFGEETLLWDLSPTVAMHTIWAHEGSVDSVRFCPNGRAVISGGADRVGRAWGLDPVTEPVQMTSHNDRIKWVACIDRLPPRILTVGLDGVLTVVDQHHVTALTLHQPTDADDTAVSGSWIWDVAVSSDDSRIATVGQDGALTIVRLDEVRLERRWSPGIGPMTSVAFSRDGQSTFVGTEAGSVYEYSVDDERGKILFEQGYVIAALDISPNGRLLLSVSADGSAIVYDQVEDRILQHIKLDDPIVVGSFGPDGAAFVTAGQDGTARIWDTSTGKLRWKFDRHLDNVAAARFVGQNRLLTGSADGRARLFDLETGLMISVLELGADVRAIDVFEDESLVAFALADGRIVVWSCVFCGDLEKARSLGYDLVAPIAASKRLDSIDLTP